MDKTLSREEGQLLDKYILRLERKMELTLRQKRIVSTKYKNLVLPQWPMFFAQTFKMAQKILRR